jgi:hypothetical protein
MSKVPSIVPISDLREDAANILSRMKNFENPYTEDDLFALAMGTGEKGISKTGFRFLARR